MGETYYATPAEGRRVPYLTPALAWMALDDLNVAGDIVCVNTNNDPDIPRERVVAHRDTDGTWTPMPSPIPAEKDSDAVA